MTVGELRASKSPASHQVDSRGLAILGLLIILVVGSSLRIFRLSSESLWLDETTSVLISQVEWAKSWESMASDPNPPLHYLALRWWIGVFGDSESSVRMLSVVFGIVSIAFMYLTARQLLGEAVGLLASLILALSQLHITYSQEARAYAMMSMLALVSTYCLLRFLRHDGSRNLLGVFFSNVCMLYTHVFASFVLASQALFVAYLWLRQSNASACGGRASSEAAGVSESKPGPPFGGVERRGLLRWVVCQFFVALAFAPWVANMLANLARIRGLSPEGVPGMGISWLGRPSVAGLARTLEHYSGAGEVGLLLFFCLFVLGVFCVGKHSGRFSWRAPAVSLSTYSWTLTLGSLDAVVLLLSWLAFPTLVPFILSIVLFPIYDPRYTIAASLSYYILVARGIRNVAAGTNRLVGMLLVCMLCASSAWGLRPYYAQTQKEQWRETERYISANMAAGEIIVFNAPYVRGAFWYYHRHHGNTTYLTGAHTVQELHEVLNQNPTATGIWLVLSHDRFTDPQGSVKKELDATYLLREEKHFVGIAIRHYTARND